MEHTDYLDRLGANAVDDDPRCAADDQLARQRNPAGATHAREIRELIDRSSDALHRIPGGVGVIFADVVRLLIKITESGA
jgi:hypothetical protein